MDEEVLTFDEIKAHFEKIYGPGCQKVYERKPIEPPKITSLEPKKIVHICTEPRDPQY